MTSDCSIWIFSIALSLSGEDQSPFHSPDVTGCDVHLKVEGANPTGSFKDRGMTMAITKAVEEGSQAVICASTGNTSASAAAYAARAGLVCAVLVPQGKIALGKLAQALVHGARLLQVEGNFDACLDLARDLSKNYAVTLVNSVNPFRIEGQKTAAFEVCDVLGSAPDVHCLPVGNADMSVIDEIINVTDRESFDLARQLSRREGIFCGGSTGTNFSAALKVAERLDEDGLVVFIVCDTGEHYLSKFHSDEWMKEKMLLEPKRITAALIAETKNGTRIRVRAGPFASKAEADKAAEKIKGLDLPAAILTL